MSKQEHEACHLKPQPTDKELMHDRESDIIGRHIGRLVRDR
jgi:hypothetical protein